MAKNSIQRCPSIVLQTCDKKKKKYLIFKNYQARHISSHQYPPPSQSSPPPTLGSTYVISYNTKTVLFFLHISSAHASPKFEGRGGEELSSELSRILERACGNKSALDLQSLSITTGEQCWVLYIDALVRKTSQINRCFLLAQI